MDDDEVKQWLSDEERQAWQPDAVEWTPRAPSATHAFWYSPTQGATMSDGSVIPNADGVDWTYAAVEPR